MHDMRIEIKLPLPENTDLSKLPDQNLAAAMDTEIDRFEKWFESKGNNNPLVGVERSIIRTFLAWKLKYEESVVDSED